MKKAISERVSPAANAELAALEALPEDRIDTSDISEQKDWSGARRGVFFRPVKQQITLRLDADVIAWFKSEQGASEGYQTRINEALRAYMERVGGADAKR